MGNQKIREPKQQRSIEKRNRIIEAGFQLFCDKGYYNTNTAEIAKLAGVSTGIVYSYFKDKKDIFIVIIENYIQNMISPMFELVKTIRQPVDIPTVVRQMLQMMLKTHTMTKSVHEEMESLAHTDEDVRRLYEKFMEDMANELLNILEQLEIRPTHAREKMHLIINLSISVVHESVYNRQDAFDYDILLEETVKVITRMLSE
jgi:AcrR family transcriptional regulator